MSKFDRITTYSEIIHSKSYVEVTVFSGSFFLEAELYLEQPLIKPWIC